MVDVSEPEIDPSWWRDVVNADSRMLSISRLILEAERDATGKPSEPVLRVLSVATSAMLRPNRWNEPFEPVATLGGRRSSLPSDLDANELALLSRIAHLMDDTDNASLRARVCDVSWFYGNRADVTLLDRAIAAYTACPSRMMLGTRKAATHGNAHWNWPSAEARTVMSRSRPWPRPCSIACGLVRAPVVTSGSSSQS